VNAVEFNPETGRMVFALAADEYLSCGTCGGAWAHENDDPEWDAGGHYDFEHQRPRCPDCDAFGTIVARPIDPAARKLAGRWGEAVIAHGFVAAPSLMLLHQGHLGLSGDQVSLLLQLDWHRRERNAVAWPSLSTLAGRCGKSEPTVRRELHRLEEAGYIEVKSRSRADGGQTTNGYTDRGLRRLLGVIASNYSEGVDPTTNLAEHLAGLRARGSQAAYARRRPALSTRVTSTETPGLSLPLDGAPLAA
jgi:DNA-binding MarR family transcriptional regulator